jgi:hypothetical protein
MLDGPVVMAAKIALDAGNVNLILPWAPKKAEAELKKAFEKTLQARKLGKAAAEVADYWFFETAVRLHREGEGAPYTGLKPAGLDWGPVVRKAEKAIETENPKEIIAFLLHTVEEDLQEKFRHAVAKKEYDEDNADAAREFVHASLGFVLYSHGLYAFVKGGGQHGEEAKGGHEH